MDSKLIDGLASKAALTDLLADYAAGIDWLDFRNMATTFWEDARFDYGIFQGSLEEFRDWVVPFESAYDRRLHMFGLPAIRLDGDKATVDATSVLMCRKGDTDENFWGRYMFEAERRGGTWRFSKLTYVINLLSRAEATKDDSAIPLHWAEGLHADHVLSMRN